MKNLCTLVFSFLLLPSLFAQTKTDTVYINGELFLQRDVSAELKIVEEHIDKDVQPHSHHLWAYYLSKPHPAVATLNQYFEDAAQEFDVPVDLLKTIGQIENNWTQMGPSIDKGWGIMHLVQNNYCNTLHEAAHLLHVRDQTLKDDARQNIRGAAALLRKYFNDAYPKKLKQKSKLSFTYPYPSHVEVMESGHASIVYDAHIEIWYPAVKKFSGLISDELQTIQADRYFSVLKDGAHSTTLWNEEVVIERHTGLNLEYIASHYKQNSARGSPGSSRSSDYGPAVSSLTTCNYTTGRNHAIDTWVNHWIGTGTAAGAVSWFQNCSAQASAHFVTANNGTIYQVVPVGNTAWHCGASGYPYNNGRSIGEEHEATNANPGLWNSTAMLQASAQMACYFCSQYGIATNQNHTSPGICGHQNMPGTNTDCPGTIPWTNWFNYFNSGSCNAVAVQPSNDYCGNEITLTVYGSSCGGSTTSDLNGATQSTAPIACGGYTSTGAKDVWFKFTATAAAHDITVVPSNGLDAVIDMRTGCPGTTIDCADVGGGEGATEVLHATGLTVGNTYNVRVYDYSGANVAPTTTNFTICVTTPCSIPAKPIISGMQAICSNQTTTLTVSNPCAGCTYNWSNNSSGSQITVSTGGNYSVTATNPCGTSASDAYGITVTPQVSPSISISTTSTTICAGASTTFSATITNGGNAPFYTWKKNGISTGGNSSFYTTTQLNDGDVVQCVLTSNAICANTLSATSNTITMNVTPVVSPSVTISANTGTAICNGQSVLFTASAVNGGSAPAFQWKLNGNNIATGITYTNTTVNNNDVITCQLTSSITTCITQNTVLSNPLTMSVSASVTPSITVFGPADSICAGKSATFTTAALGGGATPAYQWQLNGQTVNGETNSSYSTANLTSGDVVSCILTSGAVCASTPTATSNSITATVHPVVTPSVSFFLPNTTICEGNSLTSECHTVNGGTAPSYQWTINGSALPGQTDSLFSYNDFSNGDTLQVIVTSNATCASPATAISNYFIINVNTPVTPTVNITPSVDTICAGGSITFTASYTNASNPVFLWQKNGQTVAGNNFIYPANGLNNNDSIVCLLTSSSLCTTANPVFSNGIIVNALQPVTPDISISSNQGLVICAGNTVLFSSTITGGGTTPTYQWKLNGSSVGTGSTYTTNSLYNGDVVSCDLNSSLACVTNNGLATSNALQLLVSGSTIPTIQQNDCELAASFIPNVAYQWYVNNNLITGASSRFHSATQTGYYYVVVADSNFCTTQSADVYIDYTTCTTTGINETNAENVFGIYPSGNNTWEIVAGNIVNNSRAEVYNAIGQLIAIQDIKNGHSQINLTSTSAGIYLIRLTGGGNRCAIKRICKN